MSEFLSGLCAGFAAALLITAIIGAGKRNSQKGRNTIMSVSTIRRTVPTTNEMIDELAAYRATGMSPEEIAAMQRDFYVLESLANSSPDLFARASGLRPNQLQALARCGNRQKPPDRHRRE